MNYQETIILGFFNVWIKHQKSVGYVFQDGYSSCAMILFDINWLQLYDKMIN
jgi:predicted nucleic acid-binding Zn finger protein